MKKIILCLLFIVFLSGCRAEAANAAPKKICLSNIKKTISKKIRQKSKGTAKSREKSVLEDQSQEYQYYDISFDIKNMTQEATEGNITIITTFVDQDGMDTLIRPINADWDEEREIPALAKNETARLYASHCYSNIDYENYYAENNRSLEFSGFIIRIFLKGELQDEFSYPKELLGKFPAGKPKKSLAHKNITPQEDTGEKKKKSDIQAIQDFSNEKTDMKGVSGTYQNSPSRISCQITSSAAYGKGKGKGLEIWYDKKNSGGKFGKGGFCGYFMLLTKHPKSENRNITDIKFFDASKYRYLTFRVKAYAGDENFKIGIADQMHAANDDSYKSNDVTDYTEGGRIGRDWQKVKIPLSDFFVDTQALYAVSICFEGSCFPDGISSGKILIDEIQFEK